MGCQRVSLPPLCSYSHRIHSEQAEIECVFMREQFAFSILHSSGFCAQSIVRPLLIGIAKTRLPGESISSHVDTIHQNTDINLPN